jgi:hypothetical protein
MRPLRAAGINAETASMHVRAAPLICNHTQACVLRESAVGPACAKRTLTDRVMKGNPTGCAACATTSAMGYSHYIAVHERLVQVSSWC